MKQKAAHGHAKKHTGTKKHTAKGAKHHPAAQHAHHQPAKAHHPKTAHTKAKHPHHTKARALSIGDVSCCAAEALAWSLRLSGWPVGPADVLALYKLTADSPDAGASILATLDAASVFGLAGVRPVSFKAVGQFGECGCGIAGFAGGEVMDALLGAQHLNGGAVDVGDAPHLAEGSRIEGRLVAAQELRNAFLGHEPSVILGLELPGPHAVCQQDGQWWTWGEPYDPCCFPDAIIEEAWAVTWP